MPPGYTLCMTESYGGLHVECISVRGHLPCELLTARTQLGWACKLGTCQLLMTVCFLHQPLYQPNPPAGRESKL